MKTKQNEYIVTIMSKCPCIFTENLVIVFPNAGKTENVQEF